jgi:hypothetical protein
MRFLVDASMSPVVVRELREAGHDAVHVGEALRLDAPDADILEHAARDGRVIVAADTDFGDLLASREAAEPSVVLFHRQTGRRHGSRQRCCSPTLPRSRRTCGTAPSWSSRRGDFVCGRYRSPSPTKLDPPDDGLARVVIAAVVATLRGAVQSSIPSRALLLRGRRARVRDRRSSSLMSSQRSEAERSAPPPTTMMLRASVARSLSTPGLVIPRRGPRRGGSRSAAARSHAALPRLARTLGQGRSEGPGS